jgi:hypothetical protein
MDGSVLCEIVAETESLLVDGRDAPEPGAER